MALYLIVVQAHFVLNNILEGLIWLFLPAALVRNLFLPWFVLLKPFQVITNDIWAYICGSYRFIDVQASSLNDP